VEVKLLKFSVSYVHREHRGLLMEHMYQLEIRIKRAKFQACLI
jgi:hypothetical protein